MLNIFDLKAGGFLAPKPTYTEESVPDLQGKVAVVTGANTGLGKETARILLAKGAKVYAACRSEEKAKKAIEELKEATGKQEVHFLQLDLGDIPSAIKAGKELAERESRIDLAILSAGVMFPKAGSVSSQGLEMQYATNVIGHYAFITQLEQTLIKTAAVAPPSSVRVVWVSSSGHYLLAPKRPLSESSVETNVKELSPAALYGQSKLGNVLLANAMAKRLKDKGILVTSLHPGNISTDLQRHTSGFERMVINLILNPVELGVITQLYCATSPDLTVEKDSGGYFVPYARKHHSSHAKAEDPSAIEETVAFVEKTIAKYSS